MTCACGVRRTSRMEKKTGQCVTAAVSANVTVPQLALQRGGLHLPHAATQTLNWTFRLFKL